MAFAYDEVITDVKLNRVNRFSNLQEDPLKKKQQAKYVPRLLKNSKLKEQEFDLLFQKKSKVN